MITGLANLGPSQMVQSAKAEKTDKASNFDQILDSKSDKEIRTSFVKKEPLPAEKNLERLKSQTPEKDLTKNSSVDEPRMAQKEKENGRDEIDSVKSKKVSEKSGKKSQDSSQTREQVMLQFMDSMESEFSIPPERIAEAMANLSSGDQVSSPEEDATQVISQLNLPTDQEQKAYALYMGMLAQLKQVEQPVQQVPVPAFMAAAVPMDVMARKEKMAQLNSSLDRMNQNFFQVRPKEVSEQAFIPKTTENLLPAIDNGMPKNYSMMSAPQNFKSEIPMDDLMQGMEQIDPQSQEAQSLAKSLAALGAATAALDASVPNDSAPAMPTVMKNEAAPMMNMSSAMQGMQEQGFGDQKDKGDSDSSSKGDSFFANQVSGLAGHAAKADAANAATPSFAGALAMAAGAEQPQDSQANIQQIMKQAQYMIKKGGGESKIQMNPEGLGEIHMKVMVNDGKVNLEMTTDNKETKKLLESSIADLKTNLGQHKLSIDQVRVDVGNQTSNDNRNSESQSQQRQMDLRQDQSQNQQRNQARDFWSQFQDNSNERRASFMDSPGIRAYGGSRNVDPLSPGSSSSMSEKRYSGSGKGRGIDLVA